MQVIGRRLLTGLRSMHQADMVHRDVKPLNVAIMTENDPASTLLIDYGAWLERSARSCPLSHTIAQAVLDCPIKSDMCSIARVQ